MVNFTPLRDSSVIMCGVALSSRLQYLNHLLNFESSESFLRPHILEEILSVKSAIADLVDVYSLTDDLPQLL